MNKTLQWAISKIVEKAKPNFYGTITIYFQAGKVNTIKTEVTEKPELT